MYAVHSNKQRKFRIENETFRLWSYYSPSSRKLLGKGGYGVVMEALDSSNANSAVAIKKMKNVFTHLNTAKCSLRELQLLMHFSHENIIAVTDCMIPDSVSVATYQSVYYIMPKMTSTLKMVCCYQDRIEITSNHRCYIMFQVLNATKYIHECGVIHRDLKPENILINADCSIRITDFGMARGCNTIVDDELVLSEYVTTRWYRAPEIMLCSRHYRFSVDVWSIGCIWAELILRKPIFCGNNHLEQLNVIFDAIGTPNKMEAIEWIKSRDALQWVLSLKKRKMQPWMEILELPKMNSKNHKKIDKNKRVNQSEIDILSKLLILNPIKRVNVKDSLKHRFFKKIPKHFHSTKIAKKFDENQLFEKSLVDIESCRTVMLQTLKELHQRKVNEIRKTKHFSKNADNSDSSHSHSHSHSSRSYPKNPKTNRITPPSS